MLSCLMRVRVIKQLAGLEGYFAAKCGLRVAGVAHIQKRQSCLHRSFAVHTPEDQALIPSGIPSAVPLTLPVETMAHF